MLNELIIGRMQCPVCGRYMFGDLKYWWCPYCGKNGAEDTAIISNPINRITARDENGIAVYVGIHSMNSRTYAPYMGINAITEVLERLCEKEEEDENLHSEDEQDNLG